MTKQFIKFLIKILILSIFFVFIFYIWSNIIINANISNTLSNITKNENNSNFKKINSSSLWKTWVAISTNIWIKYKQRSETPATIYKDIFSINEIINDQDLANSEIIWNNMKAIEEYRNVLQVNVKQLIDTSYDKSSMLDSFIDQLEYRYLIWIENIKNLNEQKNVFEESMNSSNSSIEELKTKIQSDFNTNNSDESLNNIDEYLKLKTEYYYARTYIIYINNFLKEYTYLNNYNKLLLDTLINNKEAIIKNAYVIIPDSWNQLLKDFDLLFTEEEYKGQ